MCIEILLILRGGQGRAHRVLRPRLLLRPERVQQPGTIECPRCGARPGSATGPDHAARGLSGRQRYGLLRTMQRRVKEWRSLAARRLVVASTTSAMSV